MTKLEVEQLQALSDNYIYLLRDPETGTTGVVDPGVASPVLERLKELGWRLDWILITHHHGDHIGGVDEVKNKTGCKIAGPRKDLRRLPPLDLALGEGDSFTLGNQTATVFETPGHTSGHITFWFEPSRALFCGDVLFSLGCGRTIEGTPAELWSSLQKYAPLPGETLVYCGHEYTQANARFALTIDPGNPALRARAEEVEGLRGMGRATVPTTLADERAANPFLRPSDPGLRSNLGLEGASDVKVFTEIRGRKDRF